MKARYIRISTPNQKLERQISRKFSNEKLYIEVSSGTIKFSDRSKGKQLIGDIIEGSINYISVSSIDRLGRNALDILNTLEFFYSKNVVLKVDNLGIESMINGKPNSVFKLIISVMSNVSEMEREAILERQREGIAIAKAKGIYKGRSRGTTESTHEFLSKYKNVIKYLNQNYSLRNTAKLSEVSLGTVQKVKNKLVKTDISK